MHEGTITVHNAVKSTGPDSSPVLGVQTAHPSARNSPPQSGENYEVNQVYTHMANLKDESPTAPKPITADARRSAQKVKGDEFV